MTKSALSRRSLVGGGLTAALAGATLRPRPARAATRIRVLTNWFAEAEHGGFYQAQAEGLYGKAGLDVEIRQGGPQLNNMLLLAGGEADVIMSYDIQVLNSYARGVPVKAIFTSFQFDLMGILARPEVPSLDALKGRKIFMGNSGFSTFWPWLKLRYGYTDDMPAPKGTNLQTFVNDPTSAVVGYITSEPYVAKKNNVPIRFFLFADYGYPSYSNTMATTADFLRANPDAIARFTRASVEGWRSYLRNPSAGNALIKQQNPGMDDEQLAYGLEKIREVKAVDGGDAATMGIGTMTRERWQKTRDFLVDVNLLGADVDWTQVFTTDYIRDLKITM
jgi:NitT/TauT family transport system substrate-binding protein